MTMQNPISTKICHRHGRQYIIRAIIGETFKDVADRLVDANRKKGFSVFTKQVKHAWGKSSNIQVWAAQSKPGYAIDWTTLRDLGYYEKPGMKFMGVPRITNLGGTEVL